MNKHRFDVSLVYTDLAGKARYRTRYEVALFAGNLIDVARVSIYRIYDDTGGRLFETAEPFAVSGLLPD